MKKFMLIILMTMSLYATPVDDLIVITDSMVDCYNKNTSKGLLVFGSMNINVADSIDLVANYLETNCPYENNQIATILDKYTNKGSLALMAKSCAVILKNISNKLDKKANDFDNVFDYILKETK